MKKLLILGANGQLGQDCKKLFQDDYDVVALDLPDIDITSVDSLASIIKKVKPEIVVNCAAWTAVDKAEDNEELCRRINSDGPKNIVNALNGTNAVLVHISTDYVFDGTKQLFSAYTEDDETNPVSVYGRTKREGELPVLAYKNGAVLRTAWLYGESGNNFLRTMLKLSMQDRPIRVVADQWGSPTSSASLAKQIGTLLQSFTPGLYHATSQGYCNWYQLTIRFFEAAGIKHEVIPITTAEYPTPAKRPTNSILENKNFQRLGIDVMPNWEDEVDAFAKRVTPLWRKELEA